MGGGAESRYIFMGGRPRRAAAAGQLHSGVGRDRCQVANKADGKGSTVPVGHVGNGPRGPLVPESVN
jgi:hypothetical protein